MDLATVQEGQGTAQRSAAAPRHQTAGASSRQSMPYCCRPSHCFHATSKRAAQQAVGQQHRQSHSAVLTSTSSSSDESEDPEESSSSSSSSSEDACPAPTIAAAVPANSGAAAAAAACTQARNRVQHGCDRQQDAGMRAGFPSKQGHEQVEAQAAGWGTSLTPPPHVQWRQACQTLAQPTSHPPTMQCNTLRPLSHPLTTPTSSSCPTHTWSLAFSASGSAFHSAAAILKRAWLTSLGSAPGVLPTSRRLYSASLVFMNRLKAAGAGEEEHK